MSKNKTASILFLVGTLFWGMTFVFIKEGLESIDVYSFLFWRFFIAGVILKAFNMGRERSEYDAPVMIPAILSGTVLCISYITQTIGLKYTTASKGAFITGLSVVIVPLLISIINKRLPGKIMAASSLVAAFGLWLLTASSSMDFNRGDIWVFACAVFFAFHIIVVARFSGRVDPMNFTSAQLLVVAAVTGTIALSRGELVLPDSTSLWRDILFCALFATSFMYLVQSKFQQYISETRTAIIFSFEPFFGALTAWIYLDEIITMQMISGGLLIFAGMIISELWGE